MTNAAFRMVHFVTDPFQGGRVSIAAVVRHGDQVAVARAPHLPGAICLGRAGAVTTMRLVLEDLEGLTSFDHLPSSVGPQVQLGAAREVPAGVENPMEWVARVLLGERDERPRTTRSNERTRLRSGMSFLKARAIYKFVKHHYKPTSFDSRALTPISQYVAGRDEVLLLEPLAPSRPNWHKDLAEVTERISGYKYAMNQGARLPSGSTFITYIVGPGDPSRRDEIRRKLSGITDQVVDTLVPATADEFVGRIRALGTASTMLSDV